MEILAGLRQERDRGPSIDKIADFDHVLTLALWALVRGDAADILEIHLDLFQRLAQVVGLGRLFRTGHQAARCVQDLPDGVTGAGEPEVGGL